MERSVRAILRADVSGYVGPMGEAEKATERVGRAAETAAQTTERSTTKQSSAARRFSTDLNRSARENEASWRNVGTALTVVGGAVAAVGVASANVGIQYNSLRQIATQSLTAVTGSAEEAVEQMRRLDEFGSTSWLMRDSLIRAQQQMTGFGIETAKVVPYAEALAEGVAAAGGTSQDFEELARIMGQVNSQGKFTAQTFNQFGIRGIDAAEEIATAMGTTAGRIRSDITSGALDAGTALDALAAGLIENWEGSSDLVRNTFQGATADVEAAWRDLWAIIMTPLVDPEGGGMLTSLIGSLGDLLFMLRDDIPAPLLQAVGLLGALGTAGTVAAGAFLLLYPRLLETWTHLGKMGRVGRGAQNALRGLARPALRLAGAGAAIGVTAAAVGILVGALQKPGVARDAQDVADSIAAMAAAGESIADADLSNFMSEMGRLDLGFFEIATTQADDLAGAMDRVMDPSFTDKASRFFGAIIPGVTSYMDEYQTQVDAFGAGLAQLANQDLPAAQAAFNDLWVEQGATTQAAQALLETYPEYRAELEAVAEAAGLATDESTLLLLATGHLTGEAEEAVEAIGQYEGILAGFTEAQAAATERLEEWRDMVRAATEAFPGLLDGYNAVADANDEGVVSMQGWIEQMQEQAEAVANWQTNVITATEQVRDEVPEHMQVAGHAMVDELIAAGDEGAAALALFVNGTTEQRNELIEAWQGTGSRIGDDFTAEVEAIRAGEIPVSTEHAETVLAAFLGSIALGEEDVTINGNAVPGEAVLDALMTQVLNSEEPVTINGNDVPANEVLDALMEAIENEEESVTIDGNRIPADQVTGQLMDWVKQQEASVIIDADTALAERNIREMMDRWDGKQITLYQRLVQTGAGSAPAGHPAGPTARAHGGPIYGRAGGGRIHGPGTTTSDSIPAIGPRGTRWRLSDDEHIWSAYETRMAGGHAGMEHLRSLSRMGRLREALTGVGYRDGGRPGSPPGLVSTVRTPPPPAPHAGVTYEVHLHGVPADQPEAFASAALFEMRRFENESAYVRTVTHA